MSIVARLNHPQPGRVVWASEWSAEKPLRRIDRLGLTHVDITVTAANVATVSDAGFGSGTAGETITAGQTVYLDTADNKYKLADVNASGKDVVAGIALHGAANSQPIKFQISGVINLGATLVVGTIYVASATAGGIAPAADGASGWKTCILGVAITTANLKMSINAGGVAI